MLGFVSQPSLLLLCVPLRQPLRTFALKTEILCATPRGRHRVVLGQFQSDRYG